jgi:hypothetical protein
VSTAVAKYLDRVKKRPFLVYNGKCRTTQLTPRRVR